jgi:hypothetical protein
MTIEDRSKGKMKSKTISQDTPSKLLSICMMGRDDDYTHDFIYRITTTLNHTAQNICSLGQMDNIEILITDWGSKTPMSKTLKLSEAATKICRFIYVQPDVIRFTQNGEEYFHTSRAYNVAIRRAKGKFVLVATCDQLIQQHSLHMMISLLDGRIKVPINVDSTLLMMPRTEVPWQFIEHRPDLDEWDRYMLLNEYSLSRVSVEQLNQFGGSGGFLLPRDIYHRLGGFDEVFAGWGWSDNELGFRVSQVLPHLWLSCIGVFMFDMGHKPVGRRQLSISKPNPHIYKPFLEVNSKSWGLADYEHELQRPQFTGNIAPDAKIQEDLETPVDVRNHGWFSGILQTHNTRQHVQTNADRLAKYNHQITNENIHELLILSWYSLNYYPRRYLEFGVPNGCSACVVASASPAAEMYLVDNWEGPRTGISRQDKSDPVYLSLMLYEAGLRGYLQFINGEITTSVERLKNSFVGPFGFDLALVRTEAFGSSALQQISDLINYMVPGGALVLTGKTESNFKLIWDALQSKSSKPSFFTCEDKRTGMILS